MRGSSSVMLVVIGCTAAGDAQPGDTGATTTAVMATSDATDASASASTAAGDTEDADTSAASSTTADDCLGRPTEIVGDAVFDDASDPAMFECVTRVDGSLTIGPSGTIVAPLPFVRLREITGDAYIFRNTGLVSLDGLQSLQRVGGLLEVSTNDAMTSVSALQSLTEVSGFELFDNPVLADVGAFASSVHFIGNAEGISQLSFFGLPALEDLDDLDHVAEVTHSGEFYVTVEANSSMVDLGGIAVFLRGTSPMGVRLRDLPLLDDVRLPGVTSLGRLTMWRMDGLTSIAGLASLETAQELQLWDAPSLTSLTGLEQLTTVTESLSFGGCYGSLPTAITAMTGLEGLVAVGHLEIAGQPNLVSLDGLPTDVDLLGLSIKLNPLLPESEALAYAASAIPDETLICENMGGASTCTPGDGCSPNID